MIVYISYLVQQEQLQQNDPVAVSCPENNFFSNDLRNSDKS